MVITNLLLHQILVVWNQAIVLVDFFSAAGGLSTANATFEFNGTVENKPVFVGTKTFTLANGSAFANSEITLFQF